MTETTAYGAASQPQPAYINGSMPLDHGLRRKPIRKDSRLRASIAGGRTAEAAANAGDVHDATLPLLELPNVAEALRLWHGSCAASFRLTEIIWAATGAITAAHLARTRAATERAIASGRAIAAAGRDTRTELAWNYLHDSLDHTLAGAVASLDLVAQPAREMLDLLVQPVTGDAPIEREATDRAA